jgi:hypothetical protein
MGVIEGEREGCRRGEESADPLCHRLVDLRYLSYLVRS